MTVLALFVIAYVLGLLFFYSLVRVGAQKPPTPEPRRKERV